MRLLIECLALSPVSGTDDADSLAAEREAHGQDPTAHPPESKVTVFGATVCGIFGEHESGIIEHLSGKLKGDAVLGHVVTCSSGRGFGAACATGSWLWRVIPAIRINSRLRADPQLLVTQEGDLLGDYLDMVVAYPDVAYVAHPCTGGHDVCLTKLDPHLVQP